MTLTFGVKGIEGLYWHSDFVLPFGRMIHDHLGEKTEKPSNE